MRTFTVKVNTRKFTTSVNRRDITGQDTNRTLLTTTTDSEWVIVGYPYVRLQDIVGTLGSNIIVPGSAGPPGTAPSGYAWLIDPDGNYILDGAGNYILVPEF